MNGSAMFVFDKHKKKILLVKRRDIPVWVIPGGGIEVGESPDEAAIREVFEETGYKTKINRKVAEYKIIGTKRIEHIFEGRVIGGKSALGSESKEVNFFNIKNLPELRHPLLSKWLLDLYRNSNNVIKRKIHGVSTRQVLGQFHKHPLIVVRFLLTRVGIHLNI